MRYDLRDYQRTAAAECLSRLSRGRSDWLTHHDRSAFSLSAVTGSGKTVIATAVIEAMLHGSAEFGVDADPRATFLWVTDDPALNRQTRNKMLASSDLLRITHLRELDNSFMDHTLSPGYVNFLNVQKLSKSSGLAQGGVNSRQFSMWDVLANTVADATVDLYLVLDEAHRGMKPATDRKTVVQRIIAGQPGSNPPVPVVWGISATIERFTVAMEGVTSRTTYPPVAVDIERVAASGLIKDEIVLDEPDESGTFSTTLLREAVRTTLDFEQRWAIYSAEQGEPTVLPVLVIQVPDKASEAKLTDIVSTVASEWPTLGPSAIAHVLGEHERLHLAGRAIDWVQPESIEGDLDIRVVLAKEAISTGWDCPRAEVLYSERPAKDATHIAQIIGRMVRQPLAHRITTDDTLNSVACFLPLFDRNALVTIKNELEGEGKSGGEVRVGSSVIRAAKTFGLNPTLPAGVFESIALVPSVPAPDVLASPLRRAKELARLLTDTASGHALLPHAHKALTKVLMAKLDGLRAQHAEAVEANVANLESAEVRRSALSTAGAKVGATETVTVRTHSGDLTRDTGRIINAVKEGVGKDYFAHQASKRVDDDLLDIRTDVAGLFMVSDVTGDLDTEATKWVQARLAEFSVDIANTTGATRDAYRRVQEQTTSPEAVTVDLRDNAMAATKDSNGDDLPTFAGHLYATADGLFPFAPNDWERTVITTETARPTFVAWWRNPSRPTPASLRVAYRNDSGTWTSVQPDYMMHSRRLRDTLGVSIVDPHGDYLADARPKLVALADYSEQYGDHFVRIESLSQTDNGLMVLDLQNPTVRSAIRAFTGTQVAALYESSAATPYS